MAHDRDGVGAPAGRVSAVIVDHHAGPVLADCVRSLHREGVTTVVVVDNAVVDSASTGTRAPASLDGIDPRVEIIRSGSNLGYGSGANRGVAATDSELVLVANPDVVLHPGAVRALVAALDGDTTLALVGPRIVEPDGSRYPSARRFPSLIDAAGHALLGLPFPGNRFSRRYRMDDLELDPGPENGPRPPVEVDWVSGACFLARRQAWEGLGGFDESYFMYAEDMDLCWRAHRSGWGVAYVPGSSVTHIQGVSTRRRPYRMLLAHHRSALRFAVRSETGWRRALLPVAAAVLAARLTLSWARLALVGRGRSTTLPQSD